MCLLYCYKIKGLNFVQTVKIGILLLIGGGILISIFNTEFNIVEQLSNSIERTVTGIDDMLTGSSKSGQSARMRYFAKQWAYDYIDIRFTAINFILGAGVMTRWLDVPILQSFLDMGIIGFMFLLCSLSHIRYAYCCHGFQTILRYCLHVYIVCLIL